MIALKLAVAEGAAHLLDSEQEAVRVLDVGEKEGRSLARRYAFAPSALVARGGSRRPLTMGALHFWPEGRM